MAGVALVKALPGFTEGHPHAIGVVEHNLVSGVGIWAGADQGR